MKHSIVQYLSEKEGGKCGYCKSSTTSFSHGFWAHTMNVEDYQALIDRGWRRSGQYCYKPIMDVTCCPMYTIRCTANEFRPSKSQKKILKRFYQFMATGKVVNANSRNTELISLDGSKNIIEPIEQRMDLSSIDCSAMPLVKTIKNQSNHQPAKPPLLPCKNTVSKALDLGNLKPAKAKSLRIARRTEKLRSRGLTDAEITARFLAKKKVPVVKTVEDFILQALPKDAPHNLECSPPSQEFTKTFSTSFELYKRYQMAVHKDPPEKLQPRDYKRFLVNSPLQIRLVLVNSVEFVTTLEASAQLFANYQRAVHNEADDECDISVFRPFLVDSPLKGPPGYGSFHQQYWLDEKLIAVGVIDILPRCVSSVYFYYDPDYAHLSLGTYGALREVAFTRQLTRELSPHLHYYYMGFYIHSCVKMRYKAAFTPSYLLCPEVFSWHPFKLCAVKLDASKYSRLNDDATLRDVDGEVSLLDVLVLYNHTAMPFGSYVKRKKCDSEERKQVLEYATLLGASCARRILLYRE